jgi:hypothetical protein
LSNAEFNGGLNLSKPKLIYPVPDDNGDPRLE